MCRSQAVQVATTGPPQIEQYTPPSRLAKPGA
jgi:hypothetical protein